MKIGITCYPTYGGSGVLASELGKFLAKRGHEVTIFTATYPGAEKHIDALLSLPGAVGAFTIAQWRVLQDWEAGDV